MALTVLFYVGVGPAALETIPPAKSGTHYGKAINLFADGVVMLN